MLGFAATNMDTVNPDDASRGAASKGFSMSQPETAPGTGAPQTTALDRAVAAVKPVMWSVVAFSFFINVLGLTGSIYMMQVYDRVLSSRSIRRWCC